MSRVNKVKTTKQPQKHSAVKAHKPGKPHRGANYVSQHTESTKKSSARAAAGRKATKESSISSATKSK